VSGLRILVVDDSALGREVIAGLLAGRGHEVATAESGEEALEVLEAGRFDLVLMDLELPGMGGTETASAVRARDDRVPILAMTGHPAHEQRSRCMACGMDDFLEKPIRPDPLFAAIDRAMGKACRADALKSLAGNEGLLEKVVNAFREEEPRLLAKLRAAVESGDADALRRHAHTLSGSMRYFGETRAASCARELEAMGKAADLHGAAEALAGLEAECARLKSALEA